MHTISAKPMLNKAITSNIFGLTSHGIFIHTSSGKILFLTADPWRGPLTVNLSKPIDNLSKLKVGDEVRLDYPRLIFLTFTIVIPEDAGVWQPEPIRFKKEDYPEVLRRARRLSTALLAEASSSPFLDVLKIAVDEKMEISDKQNLMRAWLFKGKNAEQKGVLHALRRFIGLGAGLTPAGDDFIAGYLLARFYLTGGMNHEIPPLLKEARAKTTALSASLMECAVEGSADERLIDALRFIAEGGKDLAEIKKELLSYGSSSGIESLAGMAATIFLNPLS